MGPLAGVKIVEMAGIGPAPFCAMLLADMGAEVLRLDRTEPSGLGIEMAPRFNLLNRGRRSLAVDLKQPGGIRAALRLIAQADALVEGFRPGVMERLGLGPDDCTAINPRLIYGRMTGWGQDGPLAETAGHDINYIALSGALHAIGREGEAPVPPLNLVGDFGGGAAYLALGIVAALFAARQSGEGQVVDASMVEGSASLMTMFFGLRAADLWQDVRGVNTIDTGAPYYGTYETKDGRWVAVGAIEPKFYAALLDRMGLDDEDVSAQNDRARWPDLKHRFANVFRGKTRDEWCAIMEGADACFAPVLSLGEAAAHPHNNARGSFVERDGIVQPAAAPRFSRTKSEVGAPPPEAGAHSEIALAEWGFAPHEVADLIASGAVRQAEAAA